MKLAHDSLQQIKTGRDLVKERLVVGYEQEPMMSRPERPQRFVELARLDEGLVADRISPFNREPRHCCRFEKDDRVIASELMLESRPHRSEKVRAPIRPVRATIDRSAIAQQNPIRERAA